MDSIEKAIEGQSSKHTDILSKLERQEKTSDDIGRAIDAFSEKYDELLAKLDASNKTIDQLQRRTHELEVRLTCRDKELEELKSTVANLEQYSRSKNIEIHGIEETVREDLIEVIRSVATKINLEPPSRSDLEAIHRLKTGAGKIPPIIVRFKEREVRNLWISKRNALRREKVYINDNLSKQIKQLRWNTKKAATEKGYKFVWVHNGRVLVRKTEGAAVIQITSDRDLTKLT